MQANPKILTGSGTTTLGSVFLMGININKTLTGTLTITDGAATIATFAIGTTPGMHFVVPGGIRFTNFVAVLSAGDNVTVFTQATA